MRRDAYKHKSCGMIIVIFASALQAAPAKEFTNNEVAQHATRSDCWIIIDRAVYDISSAMEDHDRYKYKLDSWCGKDATEAWKTKDGKNKAHSRKAQNMLQGLRVGALKP